MKITNANDTQLFEQVLDSIVSGRSGEGLEVKRPYQDQYIQIFRFGEFKGEMDYSGHSLEHNIIKLANILQK